MRQNFPVNFMPPNLHWIIAVLWLVAPQAQAATCVYVSSYHVGYEWNDGIERGIEGVLKERCTLHKIYLDTKRNPSPEFGAQSAERAKREIERLAPDVVIACDDNASKYLIKPYYKDAKLPVVFCGLNWTADEYGYPYTNATGMIEVVPIKPLLKVVQEVVRSTRQAVYLSADNETERKDYEHYRAVYEQEGVRIKGVFVKTLKEWKQAYLTAQSANVIVLNNNSGINDWDKDEAARFVYEHAKVLTVTNYAWMMRYTMFAFTKIPEEQGEWAAQTALAIMKGKRPLDIPIVPNRRWNIYVNPRLLTRADIALPANIMHKAITLEE